MLENSQLYMIQQLEVETSSLPVANAGIHNPGGFYLSRRFTYAFYLMRLKGPAVQGTSDVKSSLDLHWSIFL